MLCCLLSCALILSAARLGRGAGENTAEFRAACAIATQAQDIVEEPTPKERGTLAELLKGAEEMKREDIAAALAAVAVIKVTAAKGGVTAERKMPRFWQRRCSTPAPGRQTRRGARSGTRRASRTGMETGRAAHGQRKKSGQQGAVRAQRGLGGQYKHFGRRQGGLEHIECPTAAGHRRRGQ
ncbi:Trypanosomal VSG domain [Trypanosoma vivax]|nr:Trypanosomal VSG domain [Trypanosoma vivax]